MWSAPLMVLAMLPLTQGVTPQPDASWLGIAGGWTVGNKQSGW